jgi:hypothetical protein
MAVDCRSPTLLKSDDSNWKDALARAKIKEVVENSKAGKGVALQDASHPVTRQRPQASVSTRA